MLNIRAIISWVDLAMCLLVRPKHNNSLPAGNTAYPASTFIMINVACQAVVSQWTAVAAIFLDNWI
jgi:hypothetical protein